MVEKQQWIVLPTLMLKLMFGLCLSPLGLVLQHGWYDWMISDYSYFDVNQYTINTALGEAIQFGCALWHLLCHIHHANDIFGPVYISKDNLSNRFHRLFLPLEDTHHLVVHFPSRPNELDLIGIPLQNPMGWVYAPPNFSTCTETIADLVTNDMADWLALALIRQTLQQFDIISESNP